MAASLSDIAGLANAFQAVQGTKSKVTQQTKLSKDDVTSLANELLAGVGGVGQIGASAKKAGLFNSTTSDLLLNDLMARAATKASVAAAPTTTKVNQEGIGISNLLMTLAVGEGLSQLGDILFKGNATAAPIVEAIPSVTKSLESGVVTGTVPDVANLITEGPTGAIGSAVTNVGSKFLPQGAANFLGNNALPIGGGLLSGILNGDDAFEVQNLIPGAGLAALAGGPIGAATYLGGTALGAFGGDILDFGKDALGKIGDIGGGIVKGLGKVLGGIF